VLLVGRVSSGTCASWIAALCTTVSLPSTSTCTASRPSKRRRSKSAGTTMPTLISPRRSACISWAGV
jgi:hypothetical protein